MAESGNNGRNFYVTLRALEPTESDKFVALDIRHICLRHKA